MFGIKIDSWEMLVSEFAQELDMSNMEAWPYVDLTDQSVGTHINSDYGDTTCEEDLNGHELVEIEPKSSHEGFELMERFAETRPEAQADKIYQALHRRHPFSTFRYAVEDIGILQEWYDFRDKALEELAEERLEKMGVIQFNTEFLQDVVARTAPDMERIEGEKRRAKAEKAYVTVIRQLSMGDLLMKGGFLSEAQDAYRKAVALAGSIASFARGAGAVDADITPVTLEDLVRVRNGLMFSAEDALILQLAVQGLDLPNASASAREFCQARREW